MIMDWIAHIFPMVLNIPPPTPPQAVAAVTTVAKAPVRAAYTPQNEAEWLEVDPCTTVTRCGDIHRAFVDLSALGEHGGVWLHYDFDELTRPLSYPDLAAESELSLAVRLIVSEVGADRLVVNQLGLQEAIGILYTVDNRLDPSIYNPDNRSDAPHFPGCGLDGSFASCANADQYLGMSTWRALDPLQHYSPSLIEAAVELAVRAWYLQERDLVPDLTYGATNYVHRCGGTAYGRPTWRCDAHLGRPQRDIPGAEPHTGPILFKGPTRWLPRRGHYRYEPIDRIDYAPWPEQPLTAPLIAAG